MARYKVYTRTGDAGDTGLYGGERVGKDDPRIEAIGTVDELNAHLGLVASALPPGSEHGQFLLVQQHRLFDIGAELAESGRAAVSETDIAALEAEIDRLDADLPELRQFILPGGSPSAATAHVARTVCRRAERSLVALDTTPPLPRQYVNRLSDYLFVLARALSADSDMGEITWSADR